ncbi:MAG: ABC transporter substrate-binding protein [Cryobacterium sp.]|nr:ABC transporter substrate-binding protein [Cryobacterium sp.]
MSRHRAAAAGIALLALIVTGCSGDPMPTPSPSASPSPTAEGPFGDGELRIGTLVPITGADAGIGLAQVAGVELAVREINEAGGVNGQPVVTFHRDSGDATSDKAIEAFAELVERGVDVVIGPSSLDLAIKLAPLAVESGVMLISPSISDPAAGAIAADGLFARTLPSARGDGSGIAAQLPPRSRVAVVYFSDDTGRGIRDSLAEGLAATQSVVVSTIALTPTMRNAETIVSQLRAADADFVVYAGSAGRSAQNTLILAALAEAGLATTVWLSSSLIGAYDVPVGALEGVSAVRAGGVTDAAFAARLRTADPRVTNWYTGAESYDAVILAALAAVVADDDGGVAIARALGGVSRDGIPCLSWGHCLHVLDTADALGNDIDYQGRSGPIDLSNRGDAAQSHYSVWMFDASNVARPVP